MFGLISSQIVKKTRQALLHPYSLYVALAIVVLAPLLKPGYVQTLDMVFVPHMPLPETLTSSYGTRALLHFFSLVIPADFVQKIVLSGMLVGSGIGMHRLFKRLYIRHFATQPPIPALLFSGVMYMINPFTYTHFMAGQYLLLIAYSLLPFFIASLLHFIDKPQRSSALTLAVLATAISWNSIHILGLAAFVAIALALAYIWAQRHKTGVLRAYVPWLGIASLAYVTLNCFWLIPLVSGSGHESGLINAFSTDDRTAFATVGNGMGQLLNVLVMRGFWADNHNIYLLPEDIFSWWYLAMAALALLAASGMVYAIIKRVRFAVTYSILAVCGAIIATGTVNSIAGGFNLWLSDIIPFFAGYREPQKFVVLIVIAYALFGGFAVSWLVNELARRKPAAQNMAWLIGGGLSLLPLLGAPLMAGGFNAQLRAQDFPPDWYTMNQRLQQLAPADNSTLFIPWHLYMPFRFTGGVAANPARAFFGHTIISSSDPEFKGALSVPTSRTQQTIDHLFARGKPTAGIGGQLAAHHIQYVLLAKEFDYADYRVGAWSGLQLIRETETLTLYKVNTE